MRAIIVYLSLFSFSVLSASESWKGQSPVHEFTGGAIAGMAIVGGSVGGAILGNIAKKILHRGFVSDINDQVFIELTGGPVFASGETLIGLSTHLRWDFHKDEDITLYGLGGLGGFIATSRTASTIFFPRFGIGGFWHLEVLSLRGEISHEWITLGVNFLF